MKKSILLAVIAAIVIAATSAIQAQGDPADFGSHSREVQDYLVMQEIDRLAAVNPWIQDINKLQPGQSVRIPVDSVTTWMISVDKWREAHGTSCLWDIAKGKLNGTLRPDVDVQKAQPIPLPVPTKADTVTVTRTSLLGWHWAAALAAILLAAALVYYLSLRRSHSLEDGYPRFMYGRDDQRRYPPVVNGGLTGRDPQQWSRQINESHPDLNALGQPTVVRGRLVSQNGQDSAKVVVETGETLPNGTRMTREVRIANNTVAAQAKYRNGTVCFFSWGCVNGLVGGDRLGLPEGWAFVADQPVQGAAVDARAADSTVVPTQAHTAVVPATDHPKIEVERRKFEGPAIRIRREQSANGTDVHEWTIETDGSLPNPVDRVVVHDPSKGGVGDTAAVEVHFLRPAGSR